MTNITMTNSYNGAVLTDESSASTYGVPVLRINNCDHGPADIVPDDPSRPALCSRTAADVVIDELTYRYASGEPNLTESEFKAANRFLATWPDGPQYTDASRLFDSPTEA